jgi:hypothetical protein
MKRVIYHVILPAIMPVLFFVIALTPVEVLGCLVRGLIALLIALISNQRDVRAERAWQRRV